MSTDPRKRLPLRMQPSTKLKIEQWYKVDNCESQNEFVEKAINFYADHLATDNITTLPIAFQSALDGRLDILEKNLSSLAYQHAVLLDMLTEILAGDLDISRDDLSRIRARSIDHVRKTNGQIKLTDHLISSYGVDDPWQN